MQNDIEKRLDYEAMARLNVAVLEVLNEDTAACLVAGDTKGLTEALRASGLALSNMTKLCTLQKRETGEEIEDTTIYDMLVAAKEKAAEINGKAKA